MERFTTYNNLLGKYQIDDDNGNVMIDGFYHIIGNAVERLAAYENTGLTSDMEAIPAADVRPVVYCEDCVHSACDGYICMNSFHTGKTFPNCFCNYGERK